MTSTGRRIRLLRDDVAIVHGSEDDAVEQGGRSSSLRYVYVDVVVKRNGRWANRGVAAGEGLVGATGYFHADDWDNAAGDTGREPISFQAI
jgi:hypothetical protein